MASSNSSEPTNHDRSTYIEWVSVKLIKKIGSAEKEHDLTRFITMFSATENIHETMVRASFVFNDSGKIFSLLPIIGGERIILEIKSLMSDSIHTLEYEVYSAKMESENNSRDQTVTLELIDVMYRKMIQQYSTSFKDKKISEFVSDFSKNVLGRELETVEDTKDKYTFAFPYMRFKNMLKYLNQYAVSGNSKSGSGYKMYLYYSTLFANHYRSISSLANGEQTEVFREVANDKVQQNKNFFSAFQFQDTFDTTLTLMKKGFKSKSQYWDSSTKEMVENEHKYQDIVAEQPILGKASLYEKTFEDDSNFVYRASTENIKNDIVIMSQIYDDAVDITINVKGIMERSCGNVVKVLFEDWSDFQQKSNENLTGYYLITKIDHAMSRGEYEQVLFLTRTGSMVQVSDDQVTSIKKAKAMITTTAKRG